MNLLRRTRMELSDAIRFSRVMRCAASATLQFRSSLCHIRQTSGIVAEDVAQLCRAARVTPLQWDRLQLERKIKSKIDRITMQDVPWDRLWPRSNTPAMHKAIILKVPGHSPGERGVLLVSFEEQWVRIFRHANIQALADDYDLLVAPSWSPPHDPALLIAARGWPRPLFHLLSNMDDREAFARLLPNGVAVSLLASNWVHPELFAPRSAGSEKSYDIVMVANFAIYKRHFLLFKAMRQLPNVRALLIGHPMEGRTTETILRQAAQFGVQDRITIRSRISDAELVDSVGAASLSVILSQNEGSCVAVVESIMADTPVLLLKEAIVGSRCFVNDATGVLADERRLASDIKQALARRGSFSPRKWALDNRIDCFGSTATLNCVLKEHANQRGERWTEDIVPHHWRPNPSYVRSSDQKQFAPLIFDFQNRYGVAIDYTDYSVNDSPLTSRNRVEQG